MNLDAKEFNEAQAEPELVVFAEAEHQDGGDGDLAEAVVAPNGEDAVTANAGVSGSSAGEGATNAGDGVDDHQIEKGRRLNFFAAPYMLKLRFKEDLVPVSLTKETAGKDMLWQKTYGAYLCKLKKANYGELFTCLEAENTASLIVPIGTNEDGGEVHQPEPTVVATEESKAVPV